MTPSLRELQHAFAAAVYEDGTAVLAHVRDGAFPAARHVQVYHRNTFASLTDALAADYPVVRRLVGEGFFDYAADYYIRRHPPLAAHLHEFGGALPAFLAEFPQAATLPYLPDVARLEWAWQSAYHAADASPLALDALATVALEKYDALIFQLHPSARLLASRYPVLRIWEVNQSDFTGEPAVDLNEGSERLLIVRRELRVEIERLSVGDYTLLSAFAESQPLLAANDAAQAADPNFDLTQSLQRHIQAGAIAQFRSA